MESFTIGNLIYDLLPTGQTSQQVDGTAREVVSTDRIKMSKQIWAYRDCVKFLTLSPWTP